MMEQIKILKNGLIIEKESCIFSCRTEDILFLSAIVKDRIDLTIRLMDETEKYFSFDISELDNVKRVLTWFCVKIDYKINADF